MTPGPGPAADRTPPGGAAADRTPPGRAAGPAIDDDEPAEDRATYRRTGPGFRTRLTFALIAAAVLPVAGFGIVVLIVAGGTGGDTTLARILLLAIAIAVVLAVLLAALLAADLSAPLREIAAAVERVSSGDLATPLEVPGDDEFSRLGESHNRLARVLERRNRELRQILEALETTTIHERPEVLVERAGEQARTAFGMVDCEVLLVGELELLDEEIVPGEARPVRATLTAAGEVLGVMAGHVPPTRSWERADQDLFELFAIAVAAAIRNAELYNRVEHQNARLVSLDEAKDDFLRGVSHNLQTPLASIRGYAQQLSAESDDRRLGIIVEQADRLSRMVRQLLTVSRIESGALRPRIEVFAVAARVRRTWEALGVADVPLAIEDRSGGWLALADPDQLDQVLWAILDNAVGHGGGTPIEVAIEIDEVDSDLAVTVTDHGPGVADADRDRLFQRFERGAGSAPVEGSGLGLYVSRELCRAMSGDLVLEPARPGRGATFTIHLPAEAPEET